MQQKDVGFSYTAPNQTKSDKPHSVQKKKTN